MIIPCSAFLLLYCVVSCCHCPLCCCRWPLPYEVMQSHRLASIHLWAPLLGVTMSFLVIIFWEIYLHFVGMASLSLQSKKVAGSIPAWPFLSVVFHLFLCFPQVLWFPPQSRDLSSKLRVFCFDILVRLGIILSNTVDLYQNTALALP